MLYKQTPTAMKTKADLHELGEEIEKHVHKIGQELYDFVDRVVPKHTQAKDFRPEADIIVTDTTYSIVMDLPGLTKKEIAITRKQDVLTIRGDREIELQEGQEFKRQERKSGAFMRSFALPEGSDASKITATFRNGVLTVQLPLHHEDEQSTHIPVQ
jgi:HSP20 family protein